MLIWQKKSDFAGRKWFEVADETTFQANLTVFCRKIILWIGLQIYGILTSFLRMVAEKMTWKWRPYKLQTLWMGPKISRENEVWTVYSFWRCGKKITWKRVPDNNMWPKLRENHVKTKYQSQRRPCPKWPPIGWNKVFWWFSLQVHWISRFMAAEVISKMVGIVTFFEGK